MESQLGEGNRKNPADRLESDVREIRPEWGRKYVPAIRALSSPVRSPYGRRSYSYRPCIERGEHGPDSGVSGNVKIDASGDVDGARWSS